MKPWREMTIDEKRQAVVEARASTKGPASVIADYLGAPSRSAVLGFCFRQGIALTGGAKGTASKIANAKARAKDKNNSELTTGRYSCVRPMTAGHGNKPLIEMRKKPERANAPVAGGASDDAGHDTSNQGKPSPTQHPSAERHPHAVEFIDREAGQCRWPLWKRGDDHRLCCGAPVAGGKGIFGRSYCAEHILASSAPRGEHMADVGSGKVSTTPNANTDLMTWKGVRGGNRNAVRVTSAKDLDRIREILAEEARKAGFTPDEVVARSLAKAPQIVALQAAMYRARSETGATADEIATIYGGRSGQTVFQAIKAHADRNRLPVPRTV